MVTRSVCQGQVLDDLSDICPVLALSLVVLLYFCIIVHQLVLLKYMKHVKTVLWLGVKTKLFFSISTYISYTFIHNNYKVNHY